MSRAASRASHRQATQRPPAAVAALAGVAVLCFLLPLVGLVARAPWRSAWRILSDDATLTALRLSLATSLAATVLAGILGMPLAWMMARGAVPGRDAVRAICTVTMVLPPVVAGVALFAAVGRRGVVGRWLDEWFGVSLPFTTAAVVVAQMFVAMPFLVLTVDAALRGLDPAPEEAARTLGGRPWFVFRHVTAPSIRGAIVSGLVLTWARALGEFGATITFAASFPGRTRTIPLATYAALDTDPPRAFMLSLVLVAVSLAVLFGLRGRWVRAAFGGQQ